MKTKLVLVWYNRLMIKSMLKMINYFKIISKIMVMVRLMYTVKAIITKCRKLNIIITKFQLSLLYLKNIIEIVKSFKLLHILIFFI